MKFNSERLLFEEMFDIVPIFSSKYYYTNYHLFTFFYFIYLLFYLQPLWPSMCIYNILTILINYYFLLWVMLSWPKSVTGFHKVYSTLLRAVVFQFWSAIWLISSIHLIAGLLFLHFLLDFQKVHILFHLWFDSPVMWPA